MTPPPLCPSQLSFRKTASAMPLPCPELHGLSMPCEEPMPSGPTVKVWRGKRPCSPPSSPAENHLLCQTEKSTSLSPNCPPFHRKRTFLLLAHPQSWPKCPPSGPSVCGKEHEEDPILGISLLGQGAKTPGYPMQGSWVRSVVRSTSRLERFACHSSRSRVLQLRPGIAKIYPYLNIEKQNQNKKASPAMSVPRGISALPEAPDSVHSD